MKRLTAGLLALMLLSLLSGCGKKEQWSVDNFFLSDAAPRILSAIATTTAPRS